LFYNTHNFNSWNQELSGQKAPISEAQAMLAAAKAYVRDEMPEALGLLKNFSTEGTSTSTTENLVNAKRLLIESLGGVALNRAGIVTDELHKKFGRIDFLAKLIFPGVAIKKFLVKNNDVPARAVRKELLTTVATRAFMLGVRPGDLDGIMKRQHALELTNAHGQRLLAKGGRGLQRVKAAFLKIARH
jgi:hypothetical protein